MAGESRPDAAALEAAASLAALNRVLRRAGSPELSPPLALVLAVVAARPGSRLHAAAQVSGLDLSTMSRHAGTLEGLGLLERRQDPSDRRGLLLHPTAAGERLVGTYLSRAARTLLEATEGWSDADRDRLFELLPRLAAGISDVR